MSLKKFGLQLELGDSFLHTGDFARQQVNP
jgi:hypothetical protein